MNNTESEIIGPKLPAYLDYPEPEPTKDFQFPPVRCTKDLYMHAANEAKNRKWSLSTLIREAVIDYLDKNK